MVGLGHQTVGSRAVVLPPGGQRVVAVAPRVGEGNLRHAVVVDVLGNQLAVGLDQGGLAAAFVHGQVYHGVPVLPCQDIRHRVAVIVDAGDKDRRLSAGQRSLYYAAPGQIGHGAGQAAAVGHRQNIGLPRVDLRHRRTVAVAAHDEQRRRIVAVQILHHEAGVAAAHQGNGLAPNVVYGHVLHGAADLPAHHQLVPAVTGEILVIHAVDAVAAALHGAQQLIALLQPLKYQYFQRLFIAGLAEKYQRLLHVVAVQIHHLHRLNVLAGGRRRVFVALGQQLLDLLVQSGVFVRYAGQRKQILHGIVHAAGAQYPQQPQQQRQQRRPPDGLFHGVPLPS